MGEPKTKTEVCMEINRLARENGIGDFFFVTEGKSIWSVTGNSHIREIVALHKKLEEEER